MFDMYSLINDTPSEKRWKPSKRFAPLVKQPGMTTRTPPRNPASEVIVDKFAAPLHDEDELEKAKLEAQKRKAARQKGKGQKKVVRGLLVRRV
jgi:hypothetical protein